MVILITPNSKKLNYGVTSSEFSAVQPNIYMNLLESVYNNIKKIPCSSIHMEADGFTYGDIIETLRRDKPDEVGVICSGSNPSASTMTMVGAIELCKEIKSKLPNQKMFIWGGHPTVMPERTKIETGVDRVIVGDDFGCEPKDIPMVDWDKINPKKYRAHNWHVFGPNINNRSPYAVLWTTLGCPFQCLSGDTKVNTIYGEIPIRELAEKYKTIPVYTYDRDKREVVIANAINIMKTGLNKELVRVNFDDGTYIDCTPDHKFLTFKQGIKNSDQISTEAKDLIKGQSVRAIRFERGGPLRNYLYVTWARKLSKSVHRLVMEYIVGRKLSRKEQVHHKDKNTFNNLPDNLLLCTSAKEHMIYHPEASDRMKNNNPAKNYTDEWKNNLSKSLKGKKRTDSQKENYRKSKLRENNPNWKGGVSNRLSEINHKIVSVEYLSDKEDVYCMEVPGYGWFFANNVLVKNCEFCCINNVFESRIYKMRDMKDVIAEVDYLVKNHGIKHLKIMDELFVSKNHKRIDEFCDAMIERQYGLNMWAFARTDTVTPELLHKLKKAGVNWLAYGFESVSQKIVTDIRKHTKVSEYEKVIGWTKDAGISIIADFIAGFWEDDFASMEENYEFMCRMNFEFLNLYPLFIYPGTPLYTKYIKNGWREEPKSWEEYSLYGEKCIPARTKRISAAELLKWRDDKYVAYYKRPEYLSMIESKFGLETRNHVDRMADIHLKRDIVLELCNVR